MAEATLKTILVIVEGGIVQEVTAAVGQTWDVWDADDFADAPVDYWEERGAATREHIRRDWPAMYAEIMKVYRKAKAADQRDARETARLLAVAATAVQHMN